MEIAVGGLYRMRRSLLWVTDSTGRSVGLSLDHLILVLSARPARAGTCLIEALFRSQKITFYVIADDLELVEE